MTIMRDAPGYADNLRIEGIVQRDPVDGIPDLCDPATVGALAGLVRLQADDILTCQHDEYGWFIDAYGHRETGGYPTEGEAWANLLLSVKP
jgi:hypothetical protein